MKDFTAEGLFPSSRSSAQNFILLNFFVRFSSVISIFTLRNSILQRHISNKVLVFSIFDSVLHCKMTVGSYAVVQYIAFLDQILWSLWLYYYILFRFYYYITSVLSLIFYFFLLINYMLLKDDKSVFYILFLHKLNMHKKKVLN